MGCNTKSKSEEGGQEEVKTEPKKDPDTPPVAVVPDAREMARLSETTRILLDASGSTPAQWPNGDTTIVVRAAFTEQSEDKADRDATIFATVGDAAEAKVFECKSMHMVGQPRVEALLRGDHMHLLCINPPAGDNKGFTDALRVTLSPAKTTLVESGTYGGEGIVDPDTIDLDEGEEGLD